jgi:hypothetical protein
MKKEPTSSTKKFHFHSYLKAIETMFLSAVRLILSTASQSDW